MPFPERARAARKSNVASPRYLHGRSIVHRDLKLPNVMAVAGDDLVVKIIDFGLSRVSRNTLDGSGHNLKVKAAGTMSTAAPEVARGAGQECEIPNFKGSYLGRFPLVSADFWTSDHLSERSRSVDAFSGTSVRGTLTLKRP